MAGTIPLGSSPLPDGTMVTFEVDYDDGLNLISLRCINGSATNAFGRLAAVASDGTESKTAVYGQSFAPGTNIIPIPDTPPNQAVIISANPNKPGKYTGFNFSSQVPG